MKTEIENTIKVLTTQAGSQVKSEDALRFSQAALNIAHVLVMLNNVKNNNTPVWNIKENP